MSWLPTFYNIADRTFAFSSLGAIWDLHLPNQLLVISFFLMTYRQSPIRYLGILSSSYAGYKYIEAALRYNFIYTGPTLLFCAAYLYGFSKASETILLILSNNLEEYRWVASDWGTDGFASNLWERLVFAFDAQNYTRAIGYKCGMKSTPQPKSRKRRLLATIAVRMSALDLLTTGLHHLATYIDRSHGGFSFFLLELLLTGLTGYALYLLFTGCYTLLMFFGVHVLRQSPNQWPPMLHKPWSAKTLREFWSHEWHQVLRRVWTFHAQVLTSPINAIFEIRETSEKIVQIIAVFFLSGLFHYIMFLMWSGISSWRNLYTFVLQGIGVAILETYGRQWSSSAARIWTYSVLLLGAGPMGIMGFCFEQGLYTDGFFKLSVISPVFSYLLGTSW